jgi:polyketide biosynthesis enoyl-CoA hydratase PksH
VVYQTIRTEAARAAVHVTLDRADQRNAIDRHMIAELHQVLGAAERDPGCRMIVLRGQAGCFCTGMDFAEAAGHDAQDRTGEPGAAGFFELLRRFTTTGVVVVSAVDGLAAGGGVGLAAASDIVYASQRASFALPEALWGLLPCSVLPFLIRRTGFQQAYAMTLSTMPVSAAEAARHHLVDEICDERWQPLRMLGYRLSKLDGSIIADAKRYFATLAPVTDELRDGAVGEFARLVTAPAVRARLAGFVTSSRMPWER